jgi:hypothetical protein
VELLGTCWLPDGRKFWAGPPVVALWRVWLGEGLVRLVRLRAAQGGEVAVSIVTSLFGQLASRCGESIFVGSPRDLRLHNSHVVATVRWFKHQARYRVGQYLLSRLAFDLTLLSSAS